MPPKEIYNPYNPYNVYVYIYIQVVYIYIISLYIYTYVYVYAYAQGIMNMRCMDYESTTKIIPKNPSLSPACRADDQGVGVQVRRKGQ